MSPCWAMCLPRGSKHARACLATCRPHACMLLRTHLGLQNDGHNDAVDGHGLAENNAAHGQEPTNDAGASVGPRTRHAARCLKALT